MRPLQQIGPYRFLALRGQVAWPLERKEILQRPGVEGTAIYLTGRRPEPFDLLAETDAASIAEAQDMAYGYRELVGFGGQILVKDGVFYPNLFEVLHFELMDLVSIAASSGGLHTPSHAFLRARWRLIMLDLRFHPNAE